MPYLVIIKWDSSCCRWKQIQRPTARYYEERCLNWMSPSNLSIQNSDNPPRVGRRIVRNRGVRVHQENTTLRINYTRFTWTDRDRSSKLRAYVDLHVVLCAYNYQLSIFMRPLTVRRNRSLTFGPALGILILLFGCHVQLQYERFGFVFLYCILSCLGVIS